jgi:predicted acylesterase/phospholipase RssA
VVRSTASNGASPTSQRQGKTALVLAGGGITGAVYEVGALRAMDDLLVGSTVNDFDIYVGTSAGALVNAFIANGFPPGQVMQLINDRHPELVGFQLGDIFRPNFEEAVQRATQAPMLLWSVCKHIVRNPGDISVSDLIWEAARLVPAGIYDGGALERYVRNTLERDSSVNSFGRLQKELYIVASELDSGARAVFGKGHMDEVPISLAVAASSAVPALYRPVQIYEKDYLDGMLHGAASLDLAIEAGAKLIVCINPMVPFNASEVRPHEHYIRRNGLQAVINQSLRTLLYSSLRYHIKNLRIKHPDVDIILIQPEMDDHEIFSHGPMDYSGRLHVAQHGFESVTRGLLENRAYFSAVLARHGIATHTDLVRAELEALATSTTADHIVQDVIEAKHGAPGRASLTSAINQLELSMRRLTDSIDRAAAGKAVEMMH